MTISPTIFYVPSYICMKKALAAKEGVVLATLLWCNINHHIRFKTFLFFCSFFGIPLEKFLPLYGVGRAVM
jgi:hypothetical protein